MMQSEYKSAINKFMVTFEIASSKAFTEAAECFYYKFEQAKLTQLQIEGGVDWLIENRTRPSKPCMLDLFKAAKLWREKHTVAKQDYPEEPGSRRENVRAMREAWDKCKAEKAAEAKTAEAWDNLKGEEGKP